ncbi:hypothetical protein BLNAU_21387 [Blattamonas nauphoetae]|uniref:Uncharacterized protein n=1 Tax=Blattamonas nauphoetae TaxID=2049346 RepID=A0ABQ9WW09_9EUKA|nr:hypothetical protein BLNAU_21387 [Blattamonas nauphoetae]
MMTSTLRSSQTFLARHKSELLAFIDHSKSKQSSIPHLTILAQLCLFPHLEVSIMALQSLSTRSCADVPTRTFLRTLELPSASTDKSSPSNTTISALPASPHEESLLLSVNAIVERLCDELTLFSSLLPYPRIPITDIMIDSNFYHHLTSTIITCLDMIEPQKNELNRPPPDMTDLLVRLLDRSWNCIFSSITYSDLSRCPIIVSTFSGVKQLCSLLVRTCHLSSPTHHSHLLLIPRFARLVPRLAPSMLEENLVRNVIDASNPIKVPTTNSSFHVYLMRAIRALMCNPSTFTKDKEERKRIRLLQFERVLTPAKHYLQFIFQQEEFIPNLCQTNYYEKQTILPLISQTLTLERELFEDGELVETGREEWEVGWLVEKTDEHNLGERLNELREYNPRMTKDEKERWKKRVERQREAGHEDAMEAWLTREVSVDGWKIEMCTEEVSEESGMNVKPDTDYDDKVDMESILRDDSYDISTW